MTNLFIGVDKENKRKKLVEIAKEYITKGYQVFYFVPEQVCLEMERYCFNKMKDIDSFKFEVLNFSRVSDRFYKDIGKRPDKPYIDEGGKKLILDLAVKEIADNLEYFNKKNNKYALDQLFEIIKLFKENKIDGSEFLNFTANSENKKIRDIAAVYESYNSILSSMYYDSSDELERLTKVTDPEYLKDKVFIFDFFSSFSKIENDFIKLIITNCKEIYFSLTCDDKLYNYKKTDKFYPVYKTIENIIRFSKESNKEIKLNKDFYETKSEIGKLSKCIFTDEKTDFSDFVKILNCGNNYNECEIIALEIKRILREEKCRFSDIAVISRDDSYRKILETVFDKYNIPIFNDNKVSLDTKPVFLYINAIFSILQRGFTRENVIKLLKSGLTKYSFEECCIVENYLNLWNISSKEFCGEDFKFHPGGFVKDFTEKDKKALDDINIIKNEIFLDISSLKEDMSNENALNMSKILYDFIVKNNIPDYIQNKAEEYQKAGFFDLAEEYTQVFNMIINIFEQLSMILGEKPVTIEEYYEYFSILSKSYEIGKIPTSIDEVFYSNAEKAKTINKKYVFLIGMNQGVFPKIYNNSSLISDFEKNKLKSFGFDLGDNEKEKSFNEKFLFFDVITLPTKRLYVTFPTATLQGEVLIRSSYVDSILNCVNNLVIDDVSILKDDFKIQDEQSAKVNINLLKDKFIFEKYPILQQKEKSIIDAENFDVEGKLNPNLESFKLNENDLNFSSSQYETYVKCPFSYFMRYMMKINPLPDTNFGQRVIGNFVHNGLEYVFKELKADNISIKDVDDEKLDNILKEFFDFYTKEVLYLNESVRTSYFYENILNILKKIITNLKDEFKGSLFEPVEFEFKIGENCQVKPLKIELENGKYLKFMGSIDRVDCYEKNGISYIRIIDYKTGKKEFKLTDVYNGINIQMLIYLFSIWENSKEDTIPAGILYYPARTSQIVLEQDYSSKDVENEMKKEFKRNGLLLDDEDILLAMENPLTGRYIPVKLSAKGEIKGKNSLTTLQELGELENYILNDVKKNGNKLIKGDISISPLVNVSPCDYCDYKGICGYNENYCQKRYYKENTDKSNKEGEN